MALQRKIDKVKYDGLKDELKGEYVQDGDGYRLDLDGEDDTGALKRAKEHETNRRRELDAEVKRLKDELASLGDVDARKRGDVEALENSWKVKNEKQATEYQAQIDKLKKLTEKTLREGTARSIAASISTAPDLLVDKLMARMTVDYEGEEPTLRILDGQGKPSALSADELSREFVDNKSYSAIMIASRATGGGAPQKQTQFSANSGGGAKGRSEVNFSKMTQAEKLAYFDKVHVQK